MLRTNTSHYRLLEMELHTYLRGEITSGINGQLESRGTLRVHRIDVVQEGGLSRCLPRNLLVCGLKAPFLQ